MPKHRDWNISGFLGAANPDLVERYLLRFFRRDELPTYLMGMNPDYALHVLGQIEEPLRAVITGDFHRINDTCYKDLPFRAAQRFGIPVHPYEKSHTIALKLFLDQPRAFEFAWALYSFAAAYAGISQHWLQRDNTRADSETIANFKSETQSFFAAQARGDHCQVYVFDHQDDMVILVLHGTHVRTVTFWQGPDIMTNPFRFACDDVLIYNKARAVLSVKVSARGDREHYVRSFAAFFLGDEALADDPARDRIYTLEPLQTRPSDWVGNGRVSAVELRGAKLKPRGSSSEVRTVEGDGLPLSEVDQKRGELTEIKLRFTIVTDGREDKVTFTITPPCVTDAVKKRHAEVIAAYLREKGVLRR